MCVYICVCVFILVVIDCIDVASDFLFTENAVPPKSTKSRNSNFSVQVQIQPKVSGCDYVCSYVCVFLVVMRVRIHIASEIFVHMNILFCCWYECAYGHSHVNIRFVCPYEHAYKYIQINATGWRKPIGCLIFRGDFPQKSSLIRGSFAENDLQLTASYGSSPPCRTCTPIECVCACVRVRDCFWLLLAMTDSTENAIPPNPSNWETQTPRYKFKLNQYTKLNLYRDAHQSSVFSWCHRLPEILSHFRKANLQIFWFAGTKSPQHRGTNNFTPLFSKNPFDTN